MLLKTSVSTSSGRAGTVGGKRSAGDADAIERARLLEEITDELEAIEALGTLEDTLAEIRRQRRLKPAAEDTNENATE